MLFVVLVFEPCEALVPLLMAPGLTRDVPLLLGVIAVFGGFTVETMLALVALGWLGTSLVDLEARLGKHAVAASEVMAGLTIVATGAAVRLFDLFTCPPRTGPVEV
jgi:nickel/cobalt exporter